MNLWYDFQTNTGKSIHKWSHYFPAYERHLTAWRNRTLTFFEIGVGKGGSLQMWSRFFGPLSTIVGVDIEPSCKVHQRDGVHVRIGDQSDPLFLDELIREFGTPDVVLDDGSHKMDHILATFTHLYPRLSKNGVYVVEDLHTAYWPEYGGGIDKAGSFINVGKKLIDQLNADHSRGAVAPDDFTRNTYALSFYDSLLVIERGCVPYKKAEQIGA
jgi:hypothetical protein